MKVQDIYITIYVFQLDDFDKQKRQLSEKLTRKENELDVVRHELNQVKEFRKKKAQMQQELDEVNSYEIIFFSDLILPYLLDQRSYVMECP